MANKNLDIKTREIKVEGVINCENIEQGVILLETEDGEIALHDYLQGFDGQTVKIVVTNKIEQPIL